MRSAGAGTDITRHKPACIPMRGEGLADTPLCKYCFIKIYKYKAAQERSNDRVNRASTDVYG